MLTQGQIAHFETFGFLVLRHLFTPEEAATMREEAEDIFREDRGGQPFAGTESQFIQPFFHRRPFLSGVLADDRIYNVGVDLLGPDFLLNGTEGRLRVGPTPWHAGREELARVRYVKFGVYLDDLTKETGCLRVIPGTHKLGSPDMFDSMRDRRDDADEDGFRPFGLESAEVPCVPLETSPGDIVIFTESVLHSSFGGAPGRHQHAFSFSSHPTTEAELEHVFATYKKTKFSMRPPESYVTSDNPRIRRMVSQLVEWGFETSKA